MNYQQSIYQRLKQKISRKFLLIFSVCILVTGGIVWACGDGGYDEDAFSNFTPEAFVAKEYSPFFYASSTAYYGYQVNDNSNTRYNDVVLQEWDNFFKHKIEKKQLETLLFKTSAAGIDSITNHFKGKDNQAVLPANLPDLKAVDLNKKQIESFLSYLLLAKECESFAVVNWDYWDNKPAAVIPSADLEKNLLKSFKNSKDTFIKQRLWFQVLRFYYFQELAKPAGDQYKQTELLTFFDQYKSIFPKAKNIIYYRGLGYVAGYYYKNKDYAQANYLYSLCYNFSSEMKVPSKWSFRPQNETDWEQSLLLAKTVEEKVTLWQLLGITQDGMRAIENIYALNPKSDKMDLLLSRLVNNIELPSYYETEVKYNKETMDKAIALTTKIANNNNTGKPYYWNLAAGYLNTLSGNYTVAKSFYNKAKTQLPVDDKLIVAQYKILDWTLFLSQLKKIDPAAEAQMIEPINWLADLRDSKDTIASLRFYKAVDQSVQTLSDLYKRQGNPLKSNCFQSSPGFYANNKNIEDLKALLTKENKTPFEKAMLRYYHFKMEDLYYQQGLMLVYKEKIDEAIVLFEKAGEKAQFELLGNPFNIRINDCHDCDFQAVQKKKYTPLTLLKAIKGMKTEMAAGKNIYTNASLLANAYYNITHYGNGRTFYDSSAILTVGNTPLEIPAEFRDSFTSGKIAEKYYLIARANTSNKEQKARATFMAAKCERNDLYNNAYNKKDVQNKNYWDFNSKRVPSGKYFAELKNQYKLTRYYKEVLKECGYFRTYARK